MHRECCLRVLCCFLGDHAPALLKWKCSGLLMQEEGGDVDVLGGHCPSGHLFYYQVWA